MRRRLHDRLQCQPPLSYYHIVSCDFSISFSFSWRYCRGHGPNAPTPAKCCGVVKLSKNHLLVGKFLYIWSS